MSFRSPFPEGPLLTSCRSPPGRPRKSNPCANTVSPEEEGKTDSNRVSSRICTDISSNRIVWTPAQDTTVLQQLVVQTLERDRGEGTKKAYIPKKQEWNKYCQQIYGNWPQSM